jgi:hypothetical protein
MVIPDGHTLIVGQGFAVDGTLQFTGSAVLYVAA